MHDVRQSADNTNTEAFLLRNAKLKQCIEGRAAYERLETSNVSARFGSLKPGSYSCSTCRYLVSCHSGLKFNILSSRSGSIGQAFRFAIRIRPRALPCLPCGYLCLEYEATAEYLKHSSCCSSTHTHFRRIGAVLQYCRRPRSDLSRLGLGTK